MGSRLIVVRAISRVWIVVVVLLTVGAAGVAVSRIRAFFGSGTPMTYSDTQVTSRSSTAPKRLRYEVFGSSGTIADISYVDVDGEPRRVDQVALPWSIEQTTNVAPVIGNIVAQGDSQYLGCRIIVNGAVKSEHTSVEINAYAYCSTASA
jgi:hypothetical protein